MNTFKEITIESAPNSLDDDDDDDDDAIDRILSMVDTIVPSPMLAGLPKPHSQNAPINIPGGCWHLEGCDGTAIKQLHMKDCLIKTNAKFVSSQMRTHGYMNQLCLNHFNDPEYSLQRNSAKLINNI